MPETLHPPYNISQPRTLQRWLDVNSQNGPLTRARYNIFIPQFILNPNVGFTYATIIGRYDYTALQPFSIKSLVGLPVGAPYTLAIMFINSSGNVQRYILSEGVNATIYQDFAQYTNQLIRQRFSIEIWCNNFPLIAMGDVRLQTSILTNQDYRWGLDVDIIPQTAMVTNFYTNDLSLPFIFNGPFNPIPPPPTPTGITDNAGNLIMDNAGNIIRDNQ